MIYFNLIYVVLPYLTALQSLCVINIQHTSTRYLRVL